MSHLTERPAIHRRHGAPLPLFMQENPMTSTSRFMRALLTGAVIVALGSTSACSWFKHRSKTNYSTSVENRPLEVPPGLDLPSTAAATMLPPAAGLGAGRTSASTEISFTEGATVAYPRVGKALEAINGVVINGRAEALGSYDVNYLGQSFLIRVQDSNGGSRLLALTPDGHMLTTGAAAQLMAMVKSKF